LIDRWNRLLQNGVALCKRIEVGAQTAGVFGGAARQLTDLIEERRHHQKKHQSHDGQRRQQEQGNGEYALEPAFFQSRNQRVQHHGD